MRICFADVYFCFFFVFFPSVKNMRQPFSGTAERIFMKRLPNDRGECNLKRRAAAWRGAKFGHFVNFSYTYFRAKKVPQS